MNVKKPADYSVMYRKLTEILARNLPQMDENQRVIDYVKDIAEYIPTRPEKGAAVAAAEFLQTNFPDRTGFSPRNVRQMRWQEMSENGIWSRRYAVDGQKRSY